MGISGKQALECFRSDDLIGLGMEADAVRRRLHPEGVVSYAIVARLSAPKSAADLESFLRAANRATEAGAKALRIEGIAAGEIVEQTLRELRKRLPDVWVEGLNAGDVARLAGEQARSVRETLARLMEWGLDGIADRGLDAGAGPQQWLEVHRAAHGMGMRTTARMVFGAGESAKERVEMLEAVRLLQEETGGVAAFSAVAADPGSGRELDGVTSVERLKSLAIARMFLDYVENVEAGAAGEGLKVLQMQLRFGANDAGAVAPEGSGEEDLRRIIRDAGFRPAERDAAYRAMMVG